jgi:hypothetical protein
VANTLASFSSKMFDAAAALRAGEELAERAAKAVAA